MANAEKIATREIVFDVADRLKAAGTAPTNRNVLHEIGGGSMTTIAGHLRDWRAKQEIAAPEIEDAVEVPGSVADTGNQAVAAIWRACQTEARREIETVTEQANQRIKDTEADRDNVLTELAEAETEITGLTANVETLTSSLREVQARCDTLTGANEHLQAETQKAMAVAEEIERRATELAESLKHERERADQLHEEVTGLQPIAQRAATAEHENAALRADIERLRADLAEERQQHELASQAGQESAAAAQVAVAETRHLKTLLAEANARSEDATAQLTKNIERLAGELETARKTATDLTYSNGLMKGELDALQRQVQEQTATLRALTPTPPKATTGRKNPAPGK